MCCQQDYGGKISKAKRKEYAIDKSINNLKKELAKDPKGLFHWRERKELDEKIDKKQISFDKAREQQKDIL